MGLHLLLTKSKEYDLLQTIHLTKNKVWIIVPRVVFVYVGCASLFDTADRESEHSDVVTRKSQSESGTASTSGFINENSTIRCIPKRFIH